MGSATYPNGSIPTVGYPRVTAGAALTAKGYETAFAFAAGASVTDAGAGGLTHAWTLVSVPAGSALTTADITGPTGLTTATLGAAWDRPGSYTFRIASTDSAAHAAVSDVVVTVGTAEGILLIADVNPLQCANRDVKALGDVAVTWTDAKNSLTLAQTGTAGIVSVDDVLGTGLVIVTQNSSELKLSATWAALAKATGRRGGTLFFGVDVTLANVDGNWEEFAVHADNSGVGYYCSVGVSGVGARRKEYRETSETTWGAALVASYRMGVRATGLDVIGFCEPSVALDPDALETMTPLTAKGPALSAVAPGGTTTHDWDTATVFRLVARAGTPGGNATYTITRLVIGWKP